jgi:tellurite resistance protein TehA-like permease
MNPGYGTWVMATGIVSTGLGIFGYPMLSDWRHLVHREPLGHDAAWWSMVFPLGMYAVAGAGYGRVTGLGFLVDIARVAVWVGFAAWLGVAVVMARSIVSPARTQMSRIGNRT